VEFEARFPKTFGNKLERPTPNSGASSKLLKFSAQRSRVSSSTLDFPAVEGAVRCWVAFVLLLFETLGSELRLASFGARSGSR
jgi:hypothetical protein